MILQIILNWASLIDPKRAVKVSSVCCEPFDWQIGV